MKLLHNNIISFFSKYKHYVIAFFVVFYIVGFLGLAIPHTHQLFVSLFPAALILSFVAILVFHHGTYDTRTILVFAAVAVTGFFIEVAGVKTHLIFGFYNYGDTLGFKIFNTPLIIALNWAVLSYITCAITDNFNFSIPVKIVTASFLMIIYDLVLEQVAPILGMWCWEENRVPLQNYFAWFIIAFIFQTFIKLAKISTRNSIALPIFIIQTIFFISLIIFL
jgi:bisanhydrobacterioruberin hydratase